MTQEKYYLPHRLMIPDVKYEKSPSGRSYMRKATEKSSPRETSKILINKNSKKITEKIRYRQYEVIFNSLSPVNGRISYDA